MSKDNAKCTTPVIYIQQNIKFETVITNNVCKIGPLKALLSQFRIRTPIFYLNSCVRSCQIAMRWERGPIARFRLICELEDNIEPVFQKIIIKINSFMICDTFTLKTERPEYFEWATCILPTDIKDSDSFEIHFTMEHSIPIIKRNTMNSSIKITPKKFELYERLKTMYYDKPCPDVKINVGYKEFLAHKSILSRSPVFAAMFSHEMLENRENTVEIKEVDPNVFEILLKFLYLGEVDEIKVTDSKNDLLFELMKVADIYQMEDLKTKLAYIATTTINISNVVNHLILADKYNILDLKKSTMLFIQKNHAKVKDTKSYENMIQKCPTLMREILCLSKE
ncbi:hypothetical protein HZH68_011109 [Vespula germanica]|uniref:BTB domain-containing protein n=1 Tax=Vespula germanica TaxID=30212 RepID=A0A834JN54_VESGE|nr:hypothetical protein HZH68_011109 [Vespula germanica]